MVGMVRNDTMRCDSRGWNWEDQMLLLQHGALAMGMIVWFDGAVELWASMTLHGLLLIALRWNEKLCTLKRGCILGIEGMWSSVLQVRIERCRLHYWLKDYTSRSEQNTVIYMIVRDIKFDVCSSSMDSGLKQKMCDNDNVNDETFYLGITSRCQWYSPIVLSWECGIGARSIKRCPTAFKAGSGLPPFSILCFFNSWSLNVIAAAVTFCRL